MAGKTFRRAKDIDPIFFEVEKDDGELIRFDCRPQIPGGLLLAFSSIGGGDGGAATPIELGRSAIKVVRELFDAAIVKDQREQFWAMLDGTSDDGIIDVPTMMELAEYLGEAYSERPTGASSDAGSPTTSNGSASTAGAPVGVSTYSRLTPVAPSISSSAGVRTAPH